MAKSKSKSKDNFVADEFELVDIFYVPKQMAGMYRALRQALVDEVHDWAQSQFDRVETIQDPEEGQGIIGKDRDSQLVFQFYFNPSNVSAGQEARDKGHLADFLQNFRQ